MLSDRARVTPVPPERIPHEWGAIAQLILPSIKGNATEMQLFKSLITGKSQAVWLTSQRVRAAMILEVKPFDGVLCCFVGYVGGKYQCGPKAFVRFVRGVMQTIEEKAKEIGCDEIRLGGRDWSSVLPDYASFDGMANGLRKAI